MPLLETLRVLREARGDAVVVTSMGAARDWGRDFPPHPLDFIHVPSSMGQTPAIGLGIALAQPSRRVIVCVGDGSLLMNLGCLVTIAAARPRNLMLLVFDNVAYEVTGGQPTPAALVGDNGVDLAAMARAAGFPAAGRIDTLDDWREQAHSILSQAGPVCTVLKVAAEPEGGPVGPLPPARERAAAFAAALANQKTG
jgi:sulfopyruvate decarboxylase subunit beta